MYNPNTGNMMGDWVWQQSRLGMQGWATGIKGNPSGTLMATWADIAPLALKAPGDSEWVYAITPSKVAAGLFNPATPGNMGGTWHFDFASDTVGFCTMHNGVLVSTNLDAARTWTYTQLTLAEADWQDSNVQISCRTWSQKGATDWSNANVYYAGLGRAGFHYTTDRNTFTKASWLPDPTHPTGNPYARYQIVAVDNASAMTGGATSRRSRVAVSSSGQGVWLSTTGCVTGTKISTASGAGKIPAVSGMAWLNGKLYVCVTDPQTQYYFTDTSAATGGAGTGAVAYVDNVRVYDPDAGTWSILAHGAQTQGMNAPFFCFTKDPRYANGFFIWAVSGECIHTQNGTDFVCYSGNGYVQNGLRLHMFGRMRPGGRPGVAAKYRYQGVGFAISNPEIIAGHLVAPLGLGPVQTPIADFPTTGYGYGENPLSATKLALWIEITPGFEGKVGEAAAFVGDEGWLTAQDVALSRFEDGRRGHLATVYNYPVSGSLSDGLNISCGPIANFATLRRTRDGQSAIAGWAYTLNGKTWQPTAHQPPNNASNNPYVAGGGACGGGYSAVDLPGYSGTLPYCCPDIRSEEWGPLRFWKGATELDMNWNGTTTHSGLQAATFAAVHDNVVFDPELNAFLIMLIGSGDDNQDPPTSWVADPLDRGGIYKLALNDWPNARRVYAGHPAKTANFAYYDCKMISAPGSLIITSNYLPVANEGSNPIVIINTTTWAKRTIGPPANFTSVALGDPFPGDPVETLFGMGWQGSTFGLWYTRDWNVTTPTWKGPFSVPEFGFPSFLAARRAVGDQSKKWGELLVALKNRGGAYGSYRHGGV